MSSDPTLEVQKAIHDVLVGSSFQTACGVTVAIYDHVPANAAAPYITISDIQTDGAAAQAYDGSDVHANITVYSVKPGKVELHGIAGQVRTFLAPRSNAGTPFALVTHRLVTWKHHQTLPMDNPDGITVKSTVMIEFNTEPL